MNKKVKGKKYGSAKKFLQPPNNGCLAAVQWRVRTEEGWNPRKPDGLVLDAEFCVNEETQSHYINRKSDLYPVYKLRDELNKFISLCEEALKDVDNQKDKAKR